LEDFMTATTTDFTALTGTYSLDPAHSSIGFVARHAMVAKVRGSFDEFEGTAVIDGDRPTDSTVSLTLTVASVDTRNQMRDDHLRTNDFLDAATYPHITFRSTGIDWDGADGFAVTGELTVKDVTRTVTIALEYQGAATDPFGNQRIGFEGTTTLLRSDYGITYNAALETGGVLVSDKIVLEFEISAIKQA
jgi:polyisoprenoid-binding protein YceI